MSTPEPEKPSTSAQTDKGPQQNKEEGNSNLDPIQILAQLNMYDYNNMKEERDIEAVDETPPLWMEERKIYFIDRSGILNSIKISTGDYLKIIWGGPITIHNPTEKVEKKQEEQEKK